ncbi:MAG: RNA-binding S4 domain-containing protein [Flavobacteriaceae bacterium]|jgi:ribosome-associated heat shock protein Hsp15|nr:RNA-binding S4 domain-containing protein [Flavobacteriaceae bacterium]CAI8348935.1 MAG: Heat shock protein 15 [uncultured Bacteroidetes bacterium]
MRIDQYLWCVRLFKSRNIATNACKKGQVLVNGQSVKPAREILPLDRIKVRKDQSWRYLEVIALPKSRVGAKLVGLYCVEKIDADEAERNQLQQLSFQGKRDQGTGRPTKKERRDLDNLTEDEQSED